jgi:ABC-type multidrug transport system ATPase subunit
MAQRLSLIFALSADPELLILDEPTSGVDYAITNLLIGELKEIIKTAGRAVIIVTQDLKFAESISNYVSYLSEESLSDFKPTEDFFETDADPATEELLKNYSLVK